MISEIVAIVLINL